MSNIYARIEQLVKILKEDKYSYGAVRASDLIEMLEFTQKAAKTLSLVKDTVDSECSMNDFYPDVCDLLEEYYGDY